MEKKVIYNTLDDILSVLFTKQQILSETMK